MRKAAKEDLILRKLIILANGDVSVVSRALRATYAITPPVKRTIRTGFFWFRKETIEERRLDLGHVVKFIQLYAKSHPPPQ